PPRVAPSPTFHSAHPGNRDYGAPDSPPQGHPGIREAPREPGGKEHDVGVRNVERDAALGGAGPAGVRLPGSRFPAVAAQLVSGDETVIAASEPCSEKPENAGIAA